MSSSEAPAGGAAGAPEEDSEATRWMQTQAQIAQIEQDVKKEQALTSELLPISELEKIYSEQEDSSGAAKTSFLRGAKYLATKYKHMRRIRGDGNCYYRAVLYSVCESIISGRTSKDELERLTKWAQGSLDEVTKYGYDKFAIEMFHEELVELFELFSKKHNWEMEDIHTKLNEEGGTSDYATWFLRVVTAAFLKSQPDRFVHFIEGGLDIPTFCAREVEPMGKECEMVCVLALAEAMKIDVGIEYLDGREFDDANGLMRHDFGPSQSDGAKPSGTKITLLYRPGHYDILYQ